ncbi:MAG: flavin-containing monooxygenase, partial [Xanthobacteraceae bacterium]
PQQGILQQVADAARIPVLDVGTVGTICEGASKVVRGLSVLTTDGAVFVGGGSGTFDAIIFATGYRPGYRSFLDAETPGEARPDRANPDATIHFVGFRNPVTGLLRAISRDAVTIAGSIVRQRRRTTAR